MSLQVIQDFDIFNPVSQGFSPFSRTSGVSLCATYLRKIARHDKNTAAQELGDRSDIGGAAILDDGLEAFSFTSLESQPSWLALIVMLFGPYTISS